MPNISRITEQLATGGDLPLHLGTVAMLTDLREVQARGVTHILDNRLEWSDEQFVSRHAPAIAYLHNGQDDIGQQMPDSWFDRGVTFALEAMRDPACVVLAHCHMGINRGPSMAYAILLAQGRDPVAGLAAIRAARPIAAIAYAGDALDWWHRRSGADLERVAAEQAAVADCFTDHPLEVVRIIREVRESERRLRLGVSA